MMEQEPSTWIAVLRGILGIGVILAIAYGLSYERKRIDWRLVGGGLLMQLLFALAVLHVPLVGSVFEAGGKMFVTIMRFSEAGLSFLLGPYASKASGFAFLLHTLPVIIFFTALVAIAYHWGIVQRVVVAVSWLLRRFMRISGAEGLVAAGNIFMGMSESPVLVKNYLPAMNRSELFLVMVTGMGTIAGTVMGTYVGMLGGTDPMAKVLFAKHLISASVMAVPGAIVLSKMLCPQTEAPTQCPIEPEKERRNTNLLDVIASGTTTGVKLFVNIAAMLLVFISLVAFANYLTNDLIGHYTGINNWIVDITDGKAQGLTFQFILGVIAAPLMWLIGVPTGDVMLVGSLLGQKTILNEFVAYFQLQQWKEAGMFVSQKSVVMSTYLLCGFANISSIGILLGALGVLAPEKRSLISSIGMRAMIGGALVSVLSATLGGMILG